VSGHFWDYDQRNGFWIFCTCGWRANSFTRGGHRRKGDRHVAYWAEIDSAKASLARNRAEALSFIERLRKAGVSADLDRKLDDIERELLT